MSTITASPSTSTILGHMLIAGSMVVSSAAVGVTGILLAETWAIANEPERPTNLIALDTYKEEQAALLEGRGYSDDSALGGVRGQTKRSKMLDYRRYPVAAAKPEVTEALSKGTFEPTILTADQKAALERLAMGGVSIDDLVTASKDDKRVAAGAAIFATNCAACHGPKGNGLVGPNLTDEFFMHGGAPENVYKVLSQGVLAKGMPSWTHLGKDKMQDLTAYVLSLIGTNVAGKAPEGVDRDGNPPK